MDEYQRNADGTDEAHGEQIYLEKRAAKCAPVGKFVLYNLLGDVPTHKQTRKE
jgi:hypothetical protein